MKWLVIQRCVSHVCRSLIEMKVVLTFSNYISRIPFVGLSLIYRLCETIKCTEFEKQKVKTHRSRNEELVPNSALFYQNVIYSMLFKLA